MAEIALTDAMRDALAEVFTTRAFAMIATASKDGVPDMTFKGSMMVWDGEHLAYWERALGTTLRNMQENPNVCVMLTNFTNRTFYKWWGVAECLGEGELRQQVMDRTVAAELDRDPERRGYAIVIRVDKVSELGKITMERGA
ncbi:hypothetical protein AYO38_00025 [bacterium SCGC AG-212-C10]|nr:hypothetical protein AYO38_00025 [bacterium SCGC AG-212-C10]